MVTKHKTKRKGPIASAMRFSGKLVDGAAKGADRLIGKVVGFNPDTLAEYEHPSLRAMVSLYIKKMGHKLNLAGTLRVARLITKLDNGKPRTSHYAEAVQYASAGNGDAVSGLREVAKETEPEYRGGGSTPVAKRAKELLSKLKESNPTGNPIELMKRTIEFDSTASAKAFVRVMEADRMIEITRGPEKKGKKWLVEYADLSKQNPRKPTIYEALYRKLGRTPTNTELKAEVERIKREVVEELATKGKLPHQRGGRRPRRNPSSDAAAMYEAFHGRPSSSIDEFEEPEHYHANLAGLGTLIGLKIRTVTGYDMTVEFNGDVMLCSNEEGTQLYLVGGDQAIDLKKVKLDGVKKDSIVVGEAWCIGYRTEKDFDDFKPIDYIHSFSEEKYYPKMRKDADLWEDAEPPEDDLFGSGELPTVRYDALNERIFLDGGRYHISRPLVGTSPGIEG